MDKTKRRGLALALIALVLAFGAGLFFFSYLSSLEREIGDRIEVLAAQEHIAARTVITPAMITKKIIPRRYAQDTYILDVKDVTDATALVDIAKGEILTRGVLDKYAGLRPGLRAVSLSVNRVQSVGGAVRPGNRVDILVSYEEGSGAQRQAKTIVLFQDVEVLGVSTLTPRRTTTTTTAPAGTSPAVGAAAEETIAPARFSPTGTLLSEATVTLALSLEDAMKLTYMENFAKDIRLVIRRLDEKASPALRPITLETFGARP